MTDGTGARLLDVLLVEDEALNRALVTAILARTADARLAASVVREAASLATARAALADRAPDLLLLDVQLPDGSGLDLATELRAQPSRQRPVIIALTAGALAVQREAAVAAGCDAVLLKPYSVEEFEAVVAAELSAAGWPSPAEP
jgi:CheY-like chemotaxis protein